MPSIPADRGFSRSAEVADGGVQQHEGAAPVRGQPTQHPGPVAGPGAVRQIVPTADRQRATVQVKVSILERDPRILTEMGARVEFLADATEPTGPEASRIVVPSEAVRDDGGQSIVWVVREGRAYRTPVDAGPVTGGRRTVRTGLLGGEMVVTVSAADLQDGVAVTVTPP